MVLIELLAFEKQKKDAQLLAKNVHLLLIVYVVTLQ